MKLYVITNLLNGKKYVGITKLALRNRWARHCSPPGKGMKRSALHGAIVRYGRDAFTMVHYASARTYEDLLELEKLVIQQERSLVGEWGYNVSHGGVGCSGAEWSDERKAKLSKALMGNKNCLGLRLSEETIQKRSSARVGRPHTPEAIERIRAAKRGRPLSAEHKRAIGLAQIGKVIPLEVRAKSSATKKGKPKTEAHKKKTSIAMRASFAARKEAHERNRAAALVVVNAAHPA
jgi:group I intron endonuclease